MPNARVLLVEDDPILRDLYSTALSESGYAVSTASEGQAAIEAFHAQAPDLVLLDIGLGTKSIDGLEVCRQLRRFSDRPIVLLTGRAEEADQLVGLLVGADDYLIKPISLRLLTAKVAAVLRRGRGDLAEEGPTQLGADDLLVDLESRRVTVRGTPVDLTRIQFDLLAALAENPDRVLTRDQLVERVWGEWYGDDHHLDTHLSRLRSKVSAAGGPRVASVVRGVGFRLR